MKRVLKKPAKAAAPRTKPQPAADDSLPFDLPPVTAAEITRARRLAAALEKHYPQAHCELNYRSPHELLVATILSAQTTDVGVNKATPALFARFPTPTDYAKATPADIEPLIRTTGFFRNKAKAVHRSMTDVVNRFGGEVPRSMDELLSLHGVARKTANVVLGNAFNINVGFVVDTHIERLAGRLGLVKPGTTVQMIERRLMALFPREQWCRLSHQFIWHGRRACKARLPECSGHPICREFGERCELRISAKSNRPPTKGR
jgi:endonuclease-3